MRVALGVEYDGFYYNGWQIQPDKVTIQSEIENALSKIAGQTVSLSQVAGRTDKGVHATAQVMHFDTEISRPESAWLHGTNRYLTERHISIRWAKAVSDEFHARFCAQRRQYRYVLLNRPIRPALLNHLVSWDNRPLTLEAMREAAAYLIGEHDFNAYRTVHCQSKNPVKTVYSLSITRQQHFIYFDIQANAFLHHMVRNIVGVLLAIGRGDKSPQWAQQVLQSRDRTQGGVTAPAGGLYLTHVDYPDVFKLPDTAPVLPQF